MAEFKVVSPFEPQGDQPQAIDTLANGVLSGDKLQVLLGVTGSGKTFTMAKLIERVQKPTIVIAHNKTLRHSFVRNFVSSFRIMQLNTLFHIMTTTSRKLILLLPIHTLKKRRT